MSPAWLLAALLSALLVSQNAELDLSTIACSSTSLQQLYDVRAFFAQRLGSPDWLATCSEAALKKIVQRCGLGGNSTVFELGFGTGRLLQVLVRDVGVHSYDALELSEGQLNATARLRQGEALGHVHLHHSSRPLDFLRGSDGVGAYSHLFALFVLDAMSAEDIRDALMSMHSLADERARLCVATMAEVPSWSVALYKAAWRVLPLVFGGGRRPIRLRSLVDPGAWAELESYIDWSEGWLPSEVTVFEARGTAAAVARAQLPARREAVLRRWGQQLNHTSPAFDDATPIVELAAASLNDLPVGIAREIVEEWLPWLSDGTLRHLAEAEIASLTKGQILERYRLLLRSMPAAQLLQEMGMFVRELDTKSLQAWVDPPTDGLSVEDLRERLQAALSEIEHSSADDPSAIAEALDKRAAIARATSRDELLEVQAWLLKNVLTPTTEMSRTDLEQAVLEQIESFSREELEEELVAAEEGLSEEELQQSLREDLLSLRRDEMERHVLDILDAGPEAAWLRPAVEEVARSALTPEDLNILRGISGPRHPQPGSAPGAHGRPDEAPGRTRARSRTSGRRGISGSGERPAVAPGVAALGPDEL